MIATRAQHLAVAKQELKIFAFKAEPKATPVYRYVCAADNTPLTKAPCDKQAGLGTWHCDKCLGTKARRIIPTQA